VCALRKNVYLIRKIRDAFPNTAVVKIGGPEPSAGPSKKQGGSDRLPFARRVREAVVDRIGTMRRLSLEQRLFPPGMTHR
jgi:hypothetical protein